MEFTQIQIDNPVVIPAIEEKVYDKQWLSHIRINSTPEKATVVAHLVPYNGESVLVEPDEAIKIENIFAEMQNESKPAELRMLYAQVMELLLQTVKAEKAYAKAKAIADEEARLAKIEADRLAEEQRLLDEQNVEENITEEDTTDEEPTPEL
jgi:hypothetical protein